MVALHDVVCLILCYPGRAIMNHPSLLGTILNTLGMEDLIYASEAVTHPKLWV